MKETDGDLWLSQNIAKILIETANLMIVGLDLDGRIRLFNEGAEKITGYARSEVHNQDWFKLFVPADRCPRVRELFQNWKQGEYSPVNGMETAIVTKSGETRCVSWKTSRLEQDGRLQGLISLGIDITEQRQAEQALQNSEMKHRTILENASEALVIVNGQGQITLFNKKAEEVFGYSREEALGQPLEILIPAESRKAHVHHREKYTQDPTTRPMAKRAVELFGRHRNGASIPLEIGLNHLQLGNEKLVVSFITDISERKRAEQALRESEKKYKELVDLLPQVVYEIDLDGRLTYASHHAFALSGHSQEELEQGLNIFEMVAPEDRERVKLDAAQSILHGNSTGTEYTIIHKDGHRIPVLVYANPILREGRPAGLRGILIDITEHKSREIELKNSEDRYRRLVEQSPEAIFLGCRGQFVFLNPAAMELFGVRSPDQILGKNVMDFIHPDSREFVEGRHRRMVEEGEAQLPAEMKYLRLDGSTVDVEVSVTPFTYHGMPGAQIIAHDITQRKQTEEVLRHTEEQLQQAQKMEAIGRLAGGIAHDFNNLLTAILGYASLMEMKLNPNDPLRANAEEISKAGKRAASLTRQLLAFSRKQVLQPIFMNFNDTVSSMEKMLQRLIGEDIDLEAVLEPNLGSVKADPGQIEQIILNLVVNSRDAMPRGGKLTLETRNVVLDENYAQTHGGIQQGPHVMLAVSDNGSGMDSATQSRIFEPFFTTKEKGKGTGLGLSTVYGIVKQSGGTINVYSEPGIGTTFKVYFPMVASPVSPELSPPDVARPLQGSETILLVEDEEMVRNLALETLRMQGYQVLEAANAGEALLLCEQHSAAVHLLMTDVVMPQLSGNDLAHRLAPLRPEMKVLFMSGYADDAVIHHGLLQPGAAFLQKPFTPELLARKVREVLDGKK